MKNKNETSTTLTLLRKVRHNSENYFQRKRPTGHSHPLVRTQKQWQISHSPLLLAVFEQAAVQQQLTYLGLEPLEGHRPSTTVRQRPRSWAIRSNSLQVQPVCLASASRSLLQVFYGRPLFLFL